MYTNGFIRYGLPIYGEQLRPRLDSPKAEAQAANEPRAGESNEQSPPPDSPKDIGVKPLAAIRETFEAREVDRISTRNLLDALKEARRRRAVGGLVEG
jgi:hypothetical protein